MIKKHCGEKANNENGWHASIGLSLEVEFKSHEKELMMKLFEVSLDEEIKRAKKSHRIRLVCLWKNIGCYEKFEPGLGS